MLLHYFKSVKIWQSYGHESVAHFRPTLYIFDSSVMLPPWGALSNATIRLPVCLSEPIPWLKTVHLWAMQCYYKTLIGNPMLEVKPTGESGRTATGSGRNETFHNHVVVYYIISFFAIYFYCVLVFHFHWNWIEYFADGRTSKSSRPKANTCRVRQPESHGTSCHQLPR